MAARPLARRLPDCPLEEHRVLAVLVAHERGLWALVLATAAFDLAITVAGLRLGLTEANPVAAFVFATWGVPGATVLKGLAVGVAAAEWAVLPPPYRSVVAPSMALPWLLAGGYNAVMLLAIAV